MLNLTKNTTCDFLRVGSVLVATINTDRINEDSARQITNEILERLEGCGGTCQQLTIDFSQVVHAGSCCLSLCLELNNVMELRDGSTVITGLDTHLRWLFEAVHLDRVLTLA